MVAPARPDLDVRDLRPEPVSEFSRPAVDVARQLLGLWLVSTIDDEPAVLRIVEAEAYGGPDDLASHARAGPTARTQPMFGPPGRAYVYLVYGMHECLNVVTETDGRAGAVLLRAGEPVAGTEVMRRRRGRPADPDHRLASGPARLCQALAVTRALNGHDLTAGDRLWLARPAHAADKNEAGDGAGDGPAPEVRSGARVGVGYAGEWAERPWRFWLAGNRSVSRP